MLSLQLACSWQWPSCIGHCSVPASSLPLVLGGGGYFFAPWENCLEMVLDFRGKLLWDQGKILCKTEVGWVQRALEITLPEKTLAMAVPPHLLLCL